MPYAVHISYPERFESVSLVHHRGNYDCSLEITYQISALKTSKKIVAPDNLKFQYNPSVITL